MSKLSLPGTSVEEALSAILEMVEKLPPRHFELLQASGLVLAEEVRSEENHPSHDTSAMDGYALRASCLAGAEESSPVELLLSGEVAAGFPTERVVEPGTAMRISTGGLLPPGADAVVMRELVELQEPEKLRFREVPKLGSHIRRAGEHLQKGEVALSPGTVLGPAQVGMAAYLGRTELSCIPRPKVAVLATGSELVSGDKALAKGQVRDSNSFALVSALQQLGCTVVLKERVVDTESALDEALERAFESADVVLTSGGISAGWHDLVRAGIEKRGGRFAFHKLRMRPGKPLGFGKAAGANFFCLPGNPVSSMVTFEIFVKPALKKMMGRSTEQPFQSAILQEQIKKRPGFSIYFRGVSGRDEEGRLTVRLTGPQGSHILRSLTEADLLIKTKEEDDVLLPGSVVSVLPYNRV